MEAGVELRPWKDGELRHPTVENVASSDVTLDVLRSGC
jgi:hypothetical protein